MIWDDFKVLSDARADASVKKGIVNKYKVEMIYYKVIKHVLAEYGIAAPAPINDSSKEQRRVQRLDGRAIENMDIDALGYARDQMASRLSGRKPSSLNTVKYDRNDDLGVDYVFGFDDDQIGDVVVDALRNSEALWSVVQTYLASEEHASSEMSDDELAERTEAEFKKICDTSNPDSIAAQIIKEMSLVDATMFESNGSMADMMYSKIKADKWIRIYEDDAEKKDAFKALSTMAAENGDVIRVGVDTNGRRNRKYVEYKSQEKDKNAFVDGVDALMLKISPLVPEVRYIWDIGYFDEAFKKNGFLMFDTYRNILVSAPESGDDYAKYSETSNAGLFSKDKNAITFSTADDDGDRYVSVARTQLYNADNQAIGSVQTNVNVENTNLNSNTRYRSLNARFKVRMISILESYSQRRLDKSDIDIINKIFDNKISGTIFGTDFSTIEENADAYFEYIEHVCKETKAHMSSHEFEIHFRNMASNGLLPVMYMTGEHTSEYYTAKQNTARFLGVYPYANYDALNKDVSVAMGDVETGARDNFKITNTKAHGDPMNAAMNDVTKNVYFRGGPITAEMVANMRHTFDTYVLGASTMKQDMSVQIRKMSRSNEPTGAYDISKFIDANGSIKYDDVIKTLEQDMTATKNEQRANFKNSRNTDRFNAALNELMTERGTVNIGNAIIDMASEINGDETEIKNVIATELAKCVSHVIRSDAWVDRNSFTVTRHIFMKYVDAYAAKCADIIANDDILADDKATAISDIDIMSDNKILNEGLREIFGSKAGKTAGMVLKANMCKYMSTQIGYEDYEKLLTLLSYSESAYYESDKLDDDKPAAGRVKIQLFSNKAFDDQRGWSANENDSQDEIENTDEEGNENDKGDDDQQQQYSASFDDDMWYSSTFAKISFDDKSYSELIDGESEADAIYRAKHPLQVAALKKVMSKLDDADPKALKITAQGVIYYEIDDEIAFKIGPVIDEKAYIQPYVERLSDDADESEKATAVETEITKIDENGNVVYDENGLAVTEHAWVRIHNEIVIEDGELKNPVVFGALDMRSLTGDQNANMNRFYGISAQIDDYDGYDHSDKHYADRARFSTYMTSVLEKIEKDMNLRRIAIDTINDDDSKNQTNKRMAHGVIYGNVGSNSLTKCYRTNTYILEDRIACKMADDFMSKYIETMQDAQDGLDQIEFDGLTDKARRFYTALAASDMDTLDEMCVSHIDMSEFGDDAGVRFDIIARMGLINSLYDTLGPKSRFDLTARQKFRQNASNIMMQAEMSHKRVVFPKITLDQNIGLYVQSVNMQQNIKGMLPGGIDRKSMRNTDSKSARVAVFAANNKFDDELTATAKQLGSVGFLGDDVKIDRLTGQVSTPKTTTKAARCRLISRGIVDFVTGEVTRFTRFVKSKAVDRAQLSANAIEKNLGVESNVNMAMINLGYNMEDGYIVAKRSAEKFGHFGEDGEYYPAKVWDKVGDSESGNKGVIAKIVDTDIEDEVELKAKLMHEYLYNRMVNGRDIGDGMAPELKEELAGMISKIARTHEAILDEAIDANRDAALDALYAKAYDHVMELAKQTGEGMAYEFFAFDSSRNDYEQQVDGKCKAEIMKEFLASYDYKSDETFTDALDVAAAEMAHGTYAPDSFDAYVVAMNDAYDQKYEQHTGWKKWDELDDDEKNELEAIADVMSENAIEPWNGYYKHEHVLWQLFTDNPDLDVAVTDVCVLTRSNPSLLMYMTDSNNNNNKLIVNGVEYGYAMGKVTLYVDSHTGDSKNISYIGESMKAGRGSGMQESYMQDAKHASDHVATWLAANDPNMASNIMKYNRKLVMNGFMIDIEDGFKISYMADVISKAMEDDELEPVSQSVSKESETAEMANIAYMAEHVPGCGFIDMSEIARPFVEQLANLHGKDDQYERIINDIGENLNFAPLLSMIRNGKISDKNIANNMASENTIRLIFTESFGASGGNFMILPKSMDKFSACVYHKDAIKQNNFRDEADVPTVVNDENGNTQYVETVSDGDHVGKFAVSLCADVKMNGETRRVAPLFLSSYDNTNEDTETTTARQDNKLQIEMFKCALGCAIIDGLRTRFNDREDVVDACDRVQSKLEARLESKYEDVTNPRNKTLDLSNKMANYLKKRLYRISFPKSLTCVWSGDPDIAIDEAGISFDKAKELGLLKYNDEFKKLSKEQQQQIPDDYEHMLERYKPLGPDDYVWVNRSPGQTTGCVRMFKARIISAHGDGLKIHPACATIFDGDFDGDTVCVANPLAIITEQLRDKIKHEKYKGATKAAVLEEIKRTMTMSANLVQTADYTDVAYKDADGEEHKVSGIHPLFIAGNADIAVAKNNMSKRNENGEFACGYDVGRELDRITVAANCIEQLKQICYDGHSGVPGKKISEEMTESIKAMRLEQIKSCMGYIRHDEEKAGDSWKHEYETIGRLVELCENDLNGFGFGSVLKDGESGKNINVRNAIAAIEALNLNRLKDIYRDMQGYISSEPCFTHGNSPLEVICNKIEDANITKKGKSPQLNALLLFGGVHDEFDVVQDKDKKFHVRAKGIGVIKRDGEGEFHIYDEKSGKEIDGSDEKFAKLAEETRLDDSKAKSDTPKNNYRSDTESNIAAQSDKSDATGVGGAVAQKLQMIFAAYGYGELGLRISGPITQKFLDAKQNVTKCEKNLKIGKTILSAVCKFQYVRELSSEYMNGKEASQVYNGHFTVDRQHPMTIGEGVTQLDNLLAIMGQPRLTDIDKKIVTACVDALQEDYLKSIGETTEKDKDGNDIEPSKKTLKYNMVDMYSAVGSVPFAAMYAVKPDMFAKYLAMAANDGKGLFENSILKPDARAVMKKLDPTNGLAAVNEAYAIRGKTIGCANMQPTNENDGPNNDAPDNDESDKKAEIIKSASSGKSRARSIKSLPGMLGSKSKKTVKPNSNDSEQKEPATPDDNDGGPGDGLG